MEHEKFEKEEVSPAEPAENIRLEGISIILPSFNPSERFDMVVDGLLAAGFSDIIIVDDGSHDGSKAHFERAARYDRCHVLTHEENKGKGAALKTAFSYLLRNHPDAVGAVTIDGDGQHRIKDILNCAYALKDNHTLVMGCRDFSAKGIPARSRMGNRITSILFRFCCGIRLSDTQTGLRGIPQCLIPQMLEVRGNRFEYETNVLLELSRSHVRFLEIPIETVYEDENKESHFRPLMDSVRIYRFIIVYALSSLAGTLADLLLFYGALRLLEAIPHETAIIISTVIARACSSFLNFNINKKAVFSGRTGYIRTMLRYYMLCIPQMLISAALVTLISRLFGNSASGITTIVKGCVDTFLFFLSFRIQQSWVFQSPKD